MQRLLGDEHGVQWAIGFSLHKTELLSQRRNPQVMKFGQEATRFVVSSRKKHESWEFNSWNRGLDYQVVLLEVSQSSHPSAGHPDLQKTSLEISQWDKTSIHFTFSGHVILVPCSVHPNKMKAASSLRPRNWKSAIAIQAQPSGRGDVKCQKLTYGTRRSKSNEKAFKVQDPPFDWQAIRRYFCGVLSSDHPTCQQ